MKLLNNQRLIIRADANSSIGTGHVMRCLALAQCWQECGGEVIFAGRIPNIVLQQKIRANACTFVELKHSFPAPDDLELLGKLIQKNALATCPWVVVDGYIFTAEYTSVLRRAGAKVLLIDDYAHQPQYLADLLLNQNLGSEKLTYKLNSDASKLLGNKYVLLRREFLKEQHNVGNDIYPEEAKHILVTMGGADPENFTLKVIEALDKLNLSQLKIKIIIGPSNPYFDLLKDRMNSVSFNGKLLTDVNNMVPLMKWSDVTITAGGSTCWELAFLGVVFLMVIVADNQERIVKSLCQAGSAVYLGWAHSLKDKELQQSLKTIISNKNERMRLSLNGKQLVDGYGVQRVIQKMEATS